MPTYFVNDVVCRVRAGNAGGTEIDVGTVDYPVSTCCGPSGIKSVEDLVAGGFEDGWEFWVTWSHRNTLTGQITEVLIDKRREKVNASDQAIFILDRPLTRGMYVKKCSDQSCIGVVKDVEVCVAVQNPVGGSVMSDIDVHRLEYNWVSENMLGVWVTMNGWIGQVVEIQKEALMHMEEYSEFMFDWTEKMYETDFKRETYIFPEEWERMEPHLRFKVPGDKVKFTSTELASVNWISKPPSRGMGWSLLRPHHYAGVAATVLFIQVREVLVLWSKKLPQPIMEAIVQKPPERLTFQEIKKSIAENNFKILSCIIPEETRVGSTVYVKNSVNIRLSTITYEQWARDYLKDFHEKNIAARNDPERVSKRNRKCFKRDVIVGEIFTGVGVFSGTVGVGGTKIQDPSVDLSFPVKIIARFSRVAVEFDPAQGRECFDSFELMPCLLQEELAFPLGSLVKIDEAQLGQGLTPNQDALSYGVVVGYDMMNENQAARYAVVNLFTIPYGGYEPIHVKQIKVPQDWIHPHSEFNMSYGDMLVRISPYDVFIGGTFIHCLDSGHIVVNTGDGGHTIISPCRALALKSRPGSVTVFEAVVQGCCSPSPSEDTNRNSEYWIPTKNPGKSLDARKLVTIRDPTPSSVSLTFWNNPKFQPFDGENITIIQSDECIPLHHYSSKAGDPDKNSLFVEQLVETMNHLDPQKYWFRVLSKRMDLAFCAMAGPVATPYEDMLFLFHIKFPSTYPKKADIYFENFFEYDVIPGTEKSEDGKIPFSWHTGTNHEEDTDSPEGFFVTRFFHQIAGHNLKAKPLTISGARSHVVTEDSQKIISEIYLRTELTRYICRQILECTPVWRNEIHSYYRIHLPKFFLRQIAWIQESSRDNTFWRCIYDIRDELLENIHELMYIYNKHL